MKFYLSILLLLCSFKSLANERPNIIFIFSDDHAYQAIGAYGSVINKTPNIDRIADTGMKFDNSFVSNSICGPSRAVIQTGKHSHINGFRQNTETFNGDQQTFPKLLQKAGYQTAMIGKWHLHSKPQGFDHWQVLPGQGQYYNPDFTDANGTHQEFGYVTDIITNKAINWVKQASSKQQPFMLMMQHKAPHRPWEPALRHLNLYKDVELPEPANLFDDYATRGTPAKNQNLNIKDSMYLTYDNKLWSLQSQPEKITQWEKNEVKPFKEKTYGRMTKEQRAIWDQAYKQENEAFLKANLSGKALTKWKYQRYVKDYLRTIASVDESVGMMLDYLEKTGLDKNTVVIYGSDQGFYLGEHGWFDKRFMYEESFRTPLLIKWPGKVQQGVNTELVQNLDYAPTFLDMAGVKVPAEMQGRSLVPLLKGEKVAWRDAIYYHYYEEPSEHGVPVHEGVRTKRYKLINFYNLGEWEFYDLEKDPHEMQNQIVNPDYKEQVVKLKKKLKELKQQYQVPN